MSLQSISYLVNMEAPIYIKYSWNTDDLVGAYKYHRQSSKYLWLSRFLIFGIGILNLAFGIFGLFSERSTEFAVFQLVIGLILLSRELIGNMIYKFRCKQLNYDNKQVEWEISQDKIVHRMINLTESTFMWELVIGVLDTPKGFLLYPQKNLFYFIPKEGFQNPEDIAQFAYLAQDKVKNWQQIS